MAAHLNVHSRNVEDGGLNVTAFALERGRRSLSAQHAGAGGEAGLKFPPLWRRLLIQTTRAAIATSTGIKYSASKTDTNLNNVPSALSKMYLPAHRNILVLLHLSAGV